MENIYVCNYSEDKKELWNDFILKAKNESFMFNRNYMEYHSDVFKDNSVMFFKENELIAVMPANISERALVSHGGLTFGGIISDYGMTTIRMMKIVEVLIDYATKNNIQKIIYKPMPYIYHKVPANEDLYALYRFNFKLIRRDVSTTISMDNKLELGGRRKRGIKKANKLGIKVERSFNFENFICILEKVLKKKYNVMPVHSSKQIELLASRFPENIKLFGAFYEGNMIAGTIIYETSQVVHTQYLAASDEGKKNGALDLVIDYLINEYYSDKKYFDFGISTEKNGTYLNEGLINQKEMFGGRAVIYDFYECTVK